MGKWIHVSEAKPEVLESSYATNGPLWGFSLRWGVLLVQFEVYQGKRRPRKEQWQAYETTGDSTGLDAEYYTDITHWMEWETPKPPKGAVQMKPE